MAHKATIICYILNIYNIKLLSWVNNCDVSGALAVFRLLIESFGSDEGREISEQFRIV